jgi:hypothetical protein
MVGNGYGEAIGKHLKEVTLSLGRCSPGQALLGMEHELCVSLTHSSWAKYPFVGQGLYNEM